MLVKMIEGATKNWGAPADWEPSRGACGGLPTRLAETSAGAMWESAWEPTPAELALLNAGGSIHLFVSANRHPVVAMSVHALQEDVT